MSCHACLDRTLRPALLPDDGANRKAAAKPLGHRNNIRLNIIMLVGEPFAGASYTGLHLVDNQQQAMLCACFLNMVNELD